MGGRVGDVWGEEGDVERVGLEGGGGEALAWERKGRGREKGRGRYVFADDADAGYGGDGDCGHDFLWKEGVVRSGRGLLKGWRRLGGEISDWICILLFTRADASKLLSLSDIRLSKYVYYL